MGEKDGIRRRTLTSLFWKIFERGGSAVTSMVVQVVMARLLTPDDFGALAIMLVFVNFGNVIVQSGLNTALVQAPGVTEVDYTTVFWMSAALAAAIYAAVFLSAPAIASFYGMPGLIWPLRVIALMFVVNAYNSVQVAKVTRDLEMRKLFVATMGSAVSSGAVGCLAALAGAGVWALVAQQLLYQVVNCVVLAAQVSWAPRFRFEPSRARALFSFGWKLLASSLLDTFQQSLSDLVIGRQFSSAQLGLVNQGKKYPQALGGMLDGAIQSVMLSTFSHVQDDRGRVRRILRRSLQVSCFVIFPAMCLLAVTAGEIVPALLGDQWTGAVPFFQIYCVTFALYPIHTSNLQALNGMGRSDLYLRLALIKKGYGIAWVVVAAVVFRDIYIMVSGYIATGVISMLVNMWPCKSVVGYSLRDQIRDIAPSLALTALAGAAAFGGASLLSAEGLAAFLLKVAVFAAVFIGGAALAKVEAWVYLLGMAKGAKGVIRKGAR